jgi:outer membrane lipase/esterase
MKSWKILLSAVAAALVVVGCGGGGSTTKAVNPRGINQMISFGDSLSDVGTYAVGGVLASGGGKYTVNSATAKNWTQVVAPQFGLPDPCPAQTGLDGSATLGFSVAVVNAATCFNHAQGGSRVTNPIGPANKLWPDTTNNFLGQLTVPVNTQIASALTAKGGSFNGKELITVLAGGNDVFAQLALYGSLVGGGSSTTAAANQVVTNMGAAGAELAGYINTQLIAKGAKNIVVINLPDVSSTPFVLSLPAGSTALVAGMVQTFNGQLQAGVSTKPEVLYVNGYTESINQTNSPATYGLSNVTAKACTTASSLFCSTATTLAVDTSRYLYADGVHLTPFGYELLAKFVLLKMSENGWL